MMYVQKLMSTKGAKERATAHVTEVPSESEYLETKHQL